MSLRTLFNIPERYFIGTVFKSFRKPKWVSTIEWARTRRMISNKETSFGVGRFNPDKTPYMEYVYDCLDNPYIPVICSMKSARIAWTETLNNYRGQRIEIDPTTMLLGFPIKEAARKFAKEKWKYFLDGVPALKDIINVGVAQNKQSIFDYEFPNGSLSLATLGSISSQKSVNYEYIEIEEPDDAPDDVAGQGDTFANLSERQKLVPLTRKKLIFGGTPTDKDFSRVEKSLKQSNYLVFKAECHHCKELVAMDHTGFDCIKYEEYPNGFIHEKYGKYNPDSSKFFCPNCDNEWTFDEKNQNIINGKKYGFTDHTGNFSKGWHPTKPHITEVFGFSFSELLSPFEGSHFKELMKAEIEAKLELEFGKELKMKSYVNNKKGQPYASGFSAMEAEEMMEYRLNYPENIIPMEGLVLTMGVDVQDNRFAIIKRAWGRNGISYRITWKEIFGDVLNKEDEIWEELKQEIISPVLHASGKQMYVSYCSIDAADNTELVYTFVQEMLEYSNINVLACKGVRSLKHSEDDIYSEPPTFDLDTDKKQRKTLAEKMGITVYNVGAHKAHEEILRRIFLTKKACEEIKKFGVNTQYKSDLFYWNETAYGKYEEQMVSCRKIITEGRDGQQVSVFKLIPGKRKEAMDAEKLALHASRAAGIHNYTTLTWQQLEKYFS